MNRRKGHVTRVYDHGPWTVVLGSNYICDGSYRRPEVDVIYRQVIKGGGCAPLPEGGYCDGIRYRRVSIPLPWFKYSMAYRLRKVPGVRRAWRAYHGLLHKLFVAPS